MKSRWNLRLCRPIVTVLAMLVAFSDRSQAQPHTFAGTAQHTAQYAAPAQHLNRLIWSTSVNINNSSGMAHYGAPLITASNTVVVPIRTATGFQVKAFEGATGRLKYTLTNDYIYPPVRNWLPVYQPVIAPGPLGLRLYYPGAGGTMYYIDNPDSDAPAPATQQCFYTNLAGYSLNATSYNATVFINTPITADTNGVIFFGFRIETNSAPPLIAQQCGFARIDSSGAASYVLATNAAGDVQTTRVPHNCAPALSNDGATLYVSCKWTNNSLNAYLLGLDTTTLATKYKVQLRDPRNNNLAGVPDDGTASPTVAPDGDVYFGVSANPGNGSRGFLLHFTGDLQTNKPPSAFGWDYTPAIVSPSLIPGYSGNAAYLLFTKYNNYAGTGDGNGINKIAILDPTATQIDPHPTANGLVEMREVIVVNGPTPDSNSMSPTYPYAVREWCINTSAVNPITGSIFAPSEDGRLYRWSPAQNMLSEVFTLGSGVFEPYVPTVIGPDGIIYTLNGGTLFAIGNYTNLSVGIFSSNPDLRTAVAGQPITFTAVVSNLNGSLPAPSGTVTFQELTYSNFTAFTTNFATNVTLVQGVAQVTTSNFLSFSNYFGNHFITANYSGDGNYQAGSATLMQKIHPSGTTLTLTSAPAVSNAVSLTATVASSPPGGGTPTGMVTFWDGTNLVRQIGLNTNGSVTITNNFIAGSHSYSAYYNSDTLFAASTGRVGAATPYFTTSTRLGDGSLQLTFTNTIGAPFTVVGSTELSLPTSTWTVLGSATETSPGQFQFIDGQATNNVQRFYQVRSP